MSVVFHKAESARRLSVAIESHYQAFDFAASERMISLGDQ